MRLGKHEKNILTKLADQSGHFEFYDLLLKYDMPKDLKNLKVLFSQSIKRLVDKGLVKLGWYVDIAPVVCRDYELCECDNMLVGYTGVAFYVDKKPKLSRIVALTAIGYKIVSEPLSESKILQQPR